MTTDGADLTLRPAQLDDLDALVRLENQCFASDRLSRRSFRHWLTAQHRWFCVALCQQRLVGYCLVLYYPGTRLARVYSLAVTPALRGQGIARRLLHAAEDAVRASGRLYLRLEVAVTNEAAIRLYESLGYQRFGLYRDYYEDHQDALRYQKCVHRYRSDSQQRAVPWIRQTTPFTCGPAALMMAMQALEPQYTPSQQEELRIWREATTIFMTSGHGGCHPLGLALAARRRHFHAEVWINQTAPLFVDSVRSEDKKRVIELVHHGFVHDAERYGIPLHYANITQQALIDLFSAGAMPIVLISTYRMDQKKAPHWLLMSGFDQDCLYVHDPDSDGASRHALDCQYLPIARDDFDKMSCFGKTRLRTATIIWPHRAAAERNDGAGIPVSGEQIHGGTQG